MVLHHAYFEVSEAAPKEWLVGRFAWLAFGHYAVAVFIVLSGFSLAAGDPMRVGSGPTSVRRARRILPPYYVALGLCPPYLARTGTSKQGMTRAGVR